MSAPCCCQARLASAWKVWLRHLLTQQASTDHQLSARYCFRHLGQIREQDKISCPGGVCSRGVPALSSNVPAFSFSMASGTLLRWRGRAMGICPQVEMCAGPACPVVRAPCTNHVEERLEGIMRKDSLHVPVFGTLNAVWRIITGHLMQCNLIGIWNPGNPGNQSWELACQLLLTFKTWTFR